MSNELITKNDENLFNLYCWHSYYEKCDSFNEALKASTFCEFDMKKFVGNFDELKQSLELCKNTTLTNNIKHTYINSKQAEFDKRKNDEYKFLIANKTVISDTIKPFTILYYTLCTISAIGFFLTLLLSFGFESIGLFFGLGILSIIILSIAIYIKGKRAKIDAALVEKHNNRNDIYLSKTLEQFAIEKGYATDKDLNWIETKKTYNICFEKFLNDNADSINQLIKMRKQLDSKIPMPISYNSSNDVDALLLIFINGRANNMMDAINIYEQDKFHNSVILNLQYLNFNLRILENRLNKINASIQMLSANITSSTIANLQSATIISQQLQGIKFNTDLIAIDNLLR